MPSTKSIVLFLALGLQLVSALPLEGRDEMAIVARKTTNKATAAATNGNGATKAKTSTAKDGSTIVDQTVKINGLNMRFKISAPASELVSGGAAGTGKLGLNVLFHGDGGQSFLDFPNQGVQNGLMGVALLSPDQGRRWGGSDPKDNTGLVRPDGPAHSAAVNELLTKVLPTVVNFDASQIFMEGVSGGSLLLSGFMIPTFGASLAVPGAVLGCGGLTPQVQVQGDISNMRLHFQSTTDDLGSLKKSIPQAITAYEKLITDPTLLTADASPNGGHCEFDEKDFVSGVQLLTDNFNSILTNTNPVAHSVVGKENIYAANAIKPQGSIADGAAKQQQGAAAAAGGAAQKASPKAANAGQGAAAGTKAASDKEAMNKAGAAKAGTADETGAEKAGTADAAGTEAAGTAEKAGTAEADAANAAGTADQATAGNDTQNKLLQILKDLIAKLQGGAAGAAAGNAGDAAADNAGDAAAKAGDAAAAKAGDAAAKAGDAAAKASGAAKDAATKAGEAAKDAIIKAGGK